MDATTAGAPLPIPRSLLLVAVGGPLLLGKTTAANALHALLPCSHVVHLDDFYRPDAEIPVDAEGRQNWDCAAAIDFDKFKAYIASVRTGAAVPVVSLEPDSDLRLSPEEEKALRDVVAAHRAVLEGHRIVLVDGFMLFHEPDVAGLFDVRLFFHSSYDTLRARRAARSGYQTLDGFWVDPPGYFSDVVWPAYEQSHRYLFENGDVNGHLNAYAREHLQIADFRNDDFTGLDAMVRWGLGAVVAALLPK